MVFSRVCLQEEISSITHADLVERVEYQTCCLGARDRRAGHAVAREARAECPLASGMLLIHNPAGSSGRTTTQEVTTNMMLLDLPTIDEVGDLDGDAPPGEETEVP